MSGSYTFFFGHQAHNVAHGCGASCGSDITRSEVAATDVDHLALLYQEFHRLPDLLQGRAPIDVVHLIEVGQGWSTPTLSAR